MFNIQKKTPASNWYTIHRNVDKEFADEFLTEMSKGGYDQSAINGSCDLENGTAFHYEESEDGGEGDCIAYRAIEA